MKKIFGQDNLIFGLLLAALCPLAVFGILYLVNYLIGTYNYNVPYVRTSTLQLLSIIVNVVLLRYYLVKRKLDKTGRGILLVTFVYILAYFVHDYLIK